MNRRRFLIGTAGVALLPGCVSDDSGPLVPPDDDDDSAPVGDDDDSVQHEIIAAAQAQAAGEDARIGKAAQFAHMIDMKVGDNHALNVFDGQTLVDQYGVNLSFGS